MSSSANKVVTMSVNPIPKGYHSVTPYLIINGAARAIDFGRSLSFSLLCRAPPHVMILLELPRDPEPIAVADLLNSDICFSES